jgi:hypothetical protein
MPLIRFCPRALNVLSSSLLLTYLRQLNYRRSSTKGLWSRVLRLGACVSRWLRVVVPASRKSHSFL